MGADAPEVKPESRHQKTIDMMVRIWKSTVGTDFKFQGGRDGKAIKTLLSYPEATDEEIERRYRFYLTIPFNVQQASFASFVSKWSASVPVKNPSIEVGDFSNTPIGVVTDF